MVDNSVWTYYSALLWRSQLFPFYTGGRTGGVRGAPTLIFDRTPPPKLRQCDVTRSKRLRVRKREQPLDETLGQSADSF